MFVLHASASHIVNHPLRLQVPSNLAQRLQQVAAVPPLVQQISAVLAAAGVASQAAGGPLDAIAAALMSPAGAAQLQPLVTGLLAGAASRAPAAAEAEVIDLDGESDMSEPDDDEMKDNPSTTVAGASPSSSSSAVDKFDDKTVSLAHRVALVKSGKFVDEKVRNWLMNAISR